MLLGTVRKLYEKMSFGAIAITITLRKKCPYSEMLWSAFSRIQIKYGNLRSKSPYSVEMRDFLPTFMESIVFDDERNLYSLPTRDGGLKIPTLEGCASIHYD